MSLKFKEKKNFRREKMIYLYIGDILTQILFCFDAVLDYSGIFYA